MKNFFSNIIERSKNFVTALTPAAKIKYMVITIITVAIAASLLVVVSLNTNEPEAPTNPEDFETGETATIDFDNEIILEIGGESSSVGTTDVTTEDPSVTTDEVSGTEKNTSAEESTNVQTENNTGSTDEPEPQPTDPSQDYNPDPQPEDTTNTPVVNPEPTETTTQTQTTPKPTETTTKAPQTEPKPTETTTAPQTQPKPTETTTKTPQTEPKPTETTKPQESEPQPVGQFSLKEKKYDYNGANVTILQVENKSQQAYTITITGKFKDANGKVIKTESKTFEGFPAGWRNYFIFQPGVKYDSVSYDLSSLNYTETVLANYFHSGNKVTLELKPAMSDGSGEYIIPASPEEGAKLKQYTGVYAVIGPVYNDFTSSLLCMSDLVIFDASGEIFYVGTSASQKIDPISLTGKRGTTDIVLLVSNVLWENKDQYVLPNNLKSVSVVTAITAVDEY